VNYTINDLIKWIQQAFWTQAQVAGFVNQQYFRRIIHRMTSDGPVHKALPVVLDATGKLDVSLLNGVATAGYIEGIVGAMVTGNNTETGITVTYDDHTQGYPSGLLLALTQTRGTLNFDAQTAGDARYGRLASANTWTANNAFNSTATSGNALSVTRNLTAASTDAPVVSIVEDHTGDDQAALYVQQDGTGDIAQFYNGAVKVVHIPDQNTNVALHIGDGTLSPRLNIDGASGVARQMSFLTASSARWIHQVTSTAESGSNVGSNYAFLARDDSGNSLSVPLLMERSTGNTMIGATVATTFAIARLEVLQPTLGSPVFQVTSTATNDDVNEWIEQNRVATTGSTPTTLHTIAITASRTYLISATVLARRTGGASGTADDGAAYRRTASYTTKAGTVTLLAAMENIVAEDVAGYDAALVISGTNVIVQVTGVATTNITWHTTVRISYVGT